MSILNTIAGAIFAVGVLALLIWRALSSADAITASMPERLTRHQSTRLLGWALFIGIVFVVWKFLP